jgi:hypothetical protein
VFDKPAVVMIVQVLERVEIEDRTLEGESQLPWPKFWTAAKVRPYSIVRLNERKKDDPDLSRWPVVMVEQKSRGQNPLRFEFGRYYLLLLNPAQRLGRGAPGTPDPIDYYSFAVPQGGFEVRRGRLVPLSSGGELDAYSGRLADDVIKEITSVK